MLAAHCDGNKAKTARRIIEVLEYFDEQHQEATVMDIVRRYNRPQSSTSELLATLVELGLLYKGNRSRRYRLTPRAAILGSVAQPEFVRHGTLSMAIDSLTAQYGISMALFGLVGVNTQIFQWSLGSRHEPRDAGQLCNGALDSLCNSAVGLLLLSTIEQNWRTGILRRLNAEAPDEEKFIPSQMNQQVQEAGMCGFVNGPVAFGSSAQVAAILLPTEGSNGPIVLGFVYEPSDDIDPSALITSLRSAISRNVVPLLHDASEPPEVLLHAA